MRHIAVIGGGQAGHSAAARLRSLGYEGRITLICGEQEPPYQRPPLSKKFLLDQFARTRLYLRGESFYSDNDIELRLGTWCQHIDIDSKRIDCGDDSIPFDKLIIATGSHPRTVGAPMGGNLAGIHTIRSLADSDRIKSELDKCARAIVIGGGYIGLEAAASLKSKGLDVTVVEAAERILQRVSARETSTRLHALHRRHGVEILENAPLKQFEGDAQGRVTAAILEDGRRIAADLAIVGIGVLPTTALAERTGLALENGIRTDINCRTSVPFVFAAGDCASFPWKTVRIRLESVQNAIEQGEAAAANALGAKQAYEPVPWFWSDQYDVKLQIAGLGHGHDRIICRQGPSSSAVSHWYFRGNEFLAVDAINDARSYMVGKKLLEAGKSPHHQTVADPDSHLAALLR